MTTEGWALIGLNSTSTSDAGEQAEEEDGGRGEGGAKASWPILRRRAIVSSRERERPVHELMYELRATKGRGERLGVWTVRGPAGEEGP